MSNKRGAGAAGAGDPLPGTVLVEVAVDSGVDRGAVSGGAASRGAEPGGAEPGGTEPPGAEPVVAASEGAEPGVAESEGAAFGGAERGSSLSHGGPPGALSQQEPLSPPQLHEWFARRTRLRSGAARARGSAAGGTGAAGAGGAAGVGARGTGAGAARVTGAAGPVGARTGCTGAAGAGGAAGVGAGGTGVGAAGFGGARTGGTGAAGDGGAARVGAGGTGAGAAGVTGAAGFGGARTEGTGAAGAGGAARVGPGDTGAGGTGPGVLDLPSSNGLTPPLLCPPPDQSQTPLQPASPLPTPSPYTEQTGGLTEPREPVSRPASPLRAVRTGRRVPRPLPPPVPGTHHMALRPSSAPLRVPLPSPPASSLADGPDPESDLARAASPTVPRVLATVVTDPSFESAAASALVTELVDFAAVCHLDYATALVAESGSACPLSVGGECALGTDVLEDRQEDFESLAAAVPHFASMLVGLEGDSDAPDILTPRYYAEGITGPYSSQWQTAMDAEMASWKSTGTYVDAVPSSGANIVDGMWIFRVKWPLGSPKACYIARGFSQRQGVDFFQTFSPTPKMITIWVLLHVAADYELHSLDFSTAFLQGSLHKEIWLRMPTWLHWVVSCRLRTTLAALGFAPSTADPSLFLCTDTSLPPFYVVVYVDDLVFATTDTEALALIKSELQKRHTCTDLAPPSDEFVEPSGLYPELVGCLMYLMTCTRLDLAYPLSILARYVALGRHRQEHCEAAKRVLYYLFSTSSMGLVLGGGGPVVLTSHADASWVDDLATQRSSEGYTFSLGSGSVSWRSTHSSSVLSSRCEAEIYAGAMAAQELRWLTDLGERPRSSPVLYVDNKAMITLCQEHRLENRMKHIALRYFLAWELQLRG
ncbi:unnamed protein product [Closterium sp. NIES-54]